MARERVFTLYDERHLPLTVRVSTGGCFLNVHVAGYGQPVSLDWQNGKLRVLVNADPTTEEPQAIELPAVGDDD